MLPMVTPVFIAKNIEPTLEQRAVHTAAAPTIPACKALRAALAHIEAPQGPTLECQRPDV